MKLREFLQDHFLKRLEEQRVLVIYDDRGRYRDLVLALASSNITVIDAAQSTILGRENAFDAWLGLSRAPTDPKRLVVLVPTIPPGDEEARFRDPFWSLAVCGRHFPEGDADHFASLCRQAKPEQIAKIDALFAAGEPIFALVDALDGGATFPVLGSLLNAQSPREILCSFLAPSPAVEAKLGASGALDWTGEWRQFTNQILGFKASQSKKAAKLREECWRAVLVADFIFDLPAAAPAALQTVPRAKDEARELVLATCRDLRASREKSPVYVEAANRVEVELELPAMFADTLDLGSEATFAFEETTFLRGAIAKAENGELEAAKQGLEARHGQLWMQNSPERQIEWRIARATLELLETIPLVEAARPQAATASDWVKFYAASGHKLDGATRQFNRAVDDAYGNLGPLETFVAQTRKSARHLADAIQVAFINAVERDGWPAAGLTRATQIFDRTAKPSLEQSRRVAYFLVDAMRYEIAAALQAQLSDELGGASTLEAACASLPTVTPIGMASLLPGADGHLCLARVGDGYAPSLRGKLISTPAHRLESVREIYGDRAEMVELSKLHDAKASSAIASAGLLLVRTQFIDEQGELNARKLRSAVGEFLSELRAALGKLASWGFQEAVLASDHGFILLDRQEAGDLITPPKGQWIAEKPRYRLGRGDSDAATINLPLADAGIRLAPDWDGEIETYVAPRTLATFSRHTPYFHGGLSLQEAVVPILHLVLSAPAKAPAETNRFEVNLTYRGASSGKITTRRPMIELSIFQNSLVGENALELRLEVFASEQRVGVASGDLVDASRETLQIEAGKAVKIPLVMDEEFEGAFEVRAKAAQSGLLLATLQLATEYLH